MASLLASIISLYKVAHVIQVYSRIHGKKFKETLGLVKRILASEGRGPDIQRNTVFLLKRIQKREEQMFAIHRIKHNMVASDGCGGKSQGKNFRVSLPSAVSASKQGLNTKLGGG
jgi:hypothetical protein